MFWRLLMLAGGLSFLVTGCQILGDEDCQSVDIGGSARFVQATCYESSTHGGMSGSTAGGLGVAIGLGMIGLAVGPVIARARRASSGTGPSGYQPYGPGGSPDTSGAMRLLKAAAWALKSVAQTGGKGSPEWNRARDALVALGDGLLSPSQAEQLLDQVKSEDFVRGYFTPEDRLILLRIAIDVAFADGTVSPSEKSALEDLAVRLRLDKNMVDAILNILRGDAGARTNELQPAYETLGVKPGAPVGEIRAAYKKLMLKHHPDRAASHEREEATRKTAVINAAYDLVMGRLDNTASSRHKTRPPTPPPPKPPPPPPPPKPKRPTLCHACQRKLAPTAKFCGYCGTKIPYQG